MFGRMTATPLVRLDTGKNLGVAGAELLATTEYPQIVRWIQFPTAPGLSLVIPRDPESGALYVCDRRDGACCAIPHLPGVECFLASRLSP
jgi:hypothetical protein